MKVVIMARVVDDDFDRGQCCICPFSANTEDGDRYCVALWDHEECALKIEEVNE